MSTKNLLTQEIDVSLSFTADIEKAVERLKKLSEQIELSLNSVNIKDNPVNKELVEAQQKVAELKVALQDAVNLKTGRIDLFKLSEAIKNNGATLKDYQQALFEMGTIGENTFFSLAEAIAKAEVPLKRTNAEIEKMKFVLKNTIRWEISSSAIHGFINAISSAFEHAENLNRSLTNIRIVTGYDVDEMSKFAKEANKAAQALSTTTTRYTDASLIYYQQGLPKEETREKTDLTVKMSNVTGEDVEQVSSYMTAIWNNFEDGSETLQHYADVITALGAETASSTDEISAGLEKFASISRMIGLSYEYATSALATVTSVTRQSPEIVGTAFKTIFARIQGLKLGDTLEDGTTLNKYSESLAKVGISIFDQYGELKKMDDILNEMGDKWKTLNKDSQVALAQQVAGIRQYNQLVSLMDNWDFFQENLDTAITATGELDKQADIYAESWEAANRRVRAAAEGIYEDLLNDQFFITLNNGFSGVLNLLDRMIEDLGGVAGLFFTISSISTSVFNKQMTGSLIALSQNWQYRNKRSRSKAEEEKNSVLDLVEDINFDTNSYEGEVSSKVIRKNLANQKLFADLEPSLTKSQTSVIQNLLDRQSISGEQLAALGREVDSLENALGKITSGLRLKIRDFLKEVYPNYSDDQIRKESDRLFSQEISPVMNLMRDLSELKNSTTEQRESGYTNQLIENINQNPLINNKYKGQRLENSSVIDYINSYLEKEEIQKNWMGLSKQENSRAREFLSYLNEQTDFSYEDLIVYFKGFLEKNNKSSKLKDIFSPLIQGIEQKEIEQIIKGVQEDLNRTTSELDSEIQINKQSFQEEISQQKEQSQRDRNQQEAKRKKKEQKHKESIVRQNKDIDYGVKEDKIEYQKLKDKKKSMELEIEEFKKKHQVELSKSGKSLLTGVEQSEYQKILQERNLINQNLDEARDNVIDVLTEKVNQDIKFFTEKIQSNIDVATPRAKKVLSSIYSMYTDKIGEIAENKQVDLHNLGVPLERIFLQNDKNFKDYQNLDWSSDVFGGRYGKAETFQSKLSTFENDLITLLDFMKQAKENPDDIIQKELGGKGFEKKQFFSTPEELEDDYKSYKSQYEDSLKDRKKALNSIKEFAEKVLVDTNGEISEILVEMRELRQKQRQLNQEEQERNLSKKSQGAKASKEYDLQEQEEKAQIANEHQNYENVLDTKKELVNFLFSNYYERSSQFHTAQENFERQVEGLKDYLLKESQKQNKAQEVIDMFQGISLIGVGGSALSAVPDIFSDENLSQAEKIANVFVSISTAIPTLATGFIMLKESNIAAALVMKLFNKEVLEFLKNGETLQHKITLIRKNFNSLLSVPGKIGLIIAAIGLLSGAIYKLSTRQSEEEKELNRTIESTKRFTEALSLARQEYENFSKQRSLYEEKILELNLLTKGTIQYYEVLQQANSAAIQLLESNKELANNITIEQGKIILSPESLDKIKTQRQEEASIFENARAVSSIQEDTAQNELQAKESLRVLEKRNAYIGNTKNNEISSEEYIEQIKELLKDPNAILQIKQGIDPIYRTPLNEKEVQAFLNLSDYWKNQNLYSNLSNIGLSDFFKNTKYYQQEKIRIKGSEMLPYEESISPLLIKQVQQKVIDNLEQGLVDNNEIERYAKSFFGIDNLFDYKVKDDKIKLIYINEEGDRSEKLSSIEDYALYQAGRREYSLKDFSSQNFFEGEHFNLEDLIQNESYSRALKAFTLGDFSNLQEHDIKQYIQLLKDAKEELISLEEKEIKLNEIKKIEKDFQDFSKDFYLQNSNLTYSDLNKYSALRSKHSDDTWKVLSRQFIHNSLLSERSEMEKMLGDLFAKSSNIADIDLDQFRNKINPEYFHMAEQLQNEQKRHAYYEGYSEIIESIQGYEHNLDLIKQGYINLAQDTLDFLQEAEDGIKSQVKNYISKTREALSLYNQKDSDTFSQGNKERLQEYEEQGFLPLEESDNLHELQVNLALNVDDEDFQELKEQGYFINENGELNETALEARYQKKRWDGVDAEEVKKYAEYLEELYGSEGEDQSEHFEELALSVYKANNALEDLSKNFKKWQDLLKNEGTVEYQQTIDKIKDSLGDLLSLPKDFISDDYISKNLNKISDIINGNYDEIQKVAAEIGNEWLNNASNLEINYDAQMAAKFNKDSSDWENAFNVLKKASNDAVNGITSQNTNALMDSLNTILQTTNMTKEAMDGIASMLGFTLDYEPVNIDTSFEVPEYTTWITPVSSASVEDDKPEGFGAGVAFKSVTTITGSKKIPQSQVGAALAYNLPGKSTNRPQIKSMQPSTQKPNLLNKSSIPASGGGGKKGGGKSPSKPKPKDYTKKEDIVERYHEITKSLEKLSDAYSDAEEESDQLYGRDKLLKMQEENNLIKKNILLLKAKAQEVQRYLQLDKKALQENEFGIKVDIQDNTILNYDEIMTEIWEELHAAEQHYNSLSTGDAQSEYQESTLSKIEKKAETMKDLISTFEDTATLAMETENEIRDKINEELTNNYEIIEYKVELKLDVNDIELSEIEFYLNKMSDDFFSMAEKVSLLKDKMPLFTEQLEIHKQAYIELDSAYKEGKISQENFIEGVKEQRQALLDSLSSLLELDKEMTHYYADTLTSAENVLSIFTNSLQSCFSVLEHFENMLGLIGKENDYGFVGEILNGQLKTTKNTLNVQKETYNMLLQQQKTIEQHLNSSPVGSKQREMIQKEYEAITKSVTEARGQVLETTEQLGEISSKLFDNNLNKARKTLESMLTGGSSIEEMMEKLDRLSKSQEEYLTKTNQLYETNKLIRKASEDMSKSDSEFAKEKYKTYIKDIEALSKKNKLSNYELKIAQSKYDLLQAQINLEEAKNAKDSLRLVRNDMGNWDYVYTADQDKVNEAQQAVEDAQNDLYNIGLEGAKDYQSKYAQTLEEAIQTFQQINENHKAGMYETEEEYNRVMLEAQQYYYEQLKTYGDLYYVGHDLMTQESFQHEEDYLFEGVGNLEDFKNSTQGYLQDCNIAYNDWRDNTKEVSDTVGNSLNELNSNVEEIVNTSDKLSSEITSSILPALEDELTAVEKITNAWAEQRDILFDIIDEYSVIAEQMGQTVESFANDFKSDIDYFALMEAYLAYNPEGKNSMAFQQLYKQRETKIDVLGLSEDVYGIRGQQSLDAMSQDTHGLSAEQVKELLNYAGISTFKTGGYTGSWGEEGKIAMLHEKELVLNQNDTENILKAVSLLNDIGPNLSTQIKEILNNSEILEMKNLFSLLDLYNNGIKDSSVNQNVYIQAEFPNVSNSTEIENAFNDILNKAIQKSSTRMI